MKKIVLFLLFYICIYIIYENNLLASIIIVDNNDPSSSKYSSFQEAYNNASEGDTIFLSPSPKIYNYGNVYITKKIIIYGIGFDLSKIPYQCKFKSSFNGYLHFKKGSEGSIIDGIDGNQLGVLIATSNISILRSECRSIECKTNEILLNTAIINNKLNGLYVNNENKYSSKGSVEIIVLNNIIESVNLTISYGSIIFSNNIIKGNITNESSLVEVFFSNNIIISSNMQCNNCIYKNNLLNKEHEGIYDETNIYYNPDDVFIDYGNNNYYLKENSPAIDAGENGTDLGIYGGFHPFVDTGLPNLPIIYSLDSTIVTSHDLGLKVTIKAKSN